MKKKFYFWLVLILLCAGIVNFNINNFYLAKILTEKETFINERATSICKYSTNFDVFEKYGALSLESINIKNEDIIIQGKIIGNKDLKQLESFIKENNLFELKEISSFKNSEGVIETQFELKNIKYSIGE
ncbi:hypothetical protein [Clostridium grantii]|uniref:Uncharacterized protein n=1 Tax=Clostridium grantii DSM 8605 TaxID=1121316 RepID=A0A1M5SG32_9CLOT|nr:hypothetical protein [Clostridium grantii]SHH37425.1 hypothetical protein SAMN02745207_00917 [Clostridium grantii DSM 8605]